MNDMGNTSIDEGQFMAYEPNNARRSTTNRKNTLGELTDDKILNEFNVEDLDTVAALD